MLVIYQGSKVLLTIEGLELRTFSITLSTGPWWVSKMLFHVREYTNSHVADNLLFPVHLERCIIKVRDFAQIWSISILNMFSPKLFPNVFQGVYDFLNIAKTPPPPTFIKIPEHLALRGDRELSLTFFWHIANWRKQL